MGLKIKVRPGQQIFVNGAVIRNAGRGQATLEFTNQSDVLRAEEILNEAMATTPVRRLCHMIQLAIADPDGRSNILDKIWPALTEIEDILLHSQGSALRTARAELEKGNFYKAFATLRPVITYEDDLLSRAYSEHQAYEGQ